MNILVPLIENRLFPATYDKTSFKKPTEQFKKEFGAKIINVSDRSTMGNLSVYLLQLTTSELSALFLSLGRHCLHQLFVAVSRS